MAIFYDILMWMRPVCNSQPSIQFLGFKYAKNNMSTLGRVAPYAISQCKHLWRYSFRKFQVLGETNFHYNELYINQDSQRTTDKKK